MASLTKRIPLRPEERAALAELQRLRERGVIGPPTLADIRQNAYNRVIRAYESALRGDVA